MITVRSSNFGAASYERERVVVMQIRDGYTSVRPNPEYDPFEVSAWLDDEAGEGDLYITHDGRFLFSDRRAAMVFKLRFG